MIVADRPTDPPEDPIGERDPEYNKYIHDEELAMTTKKLTDNKPPKAIELEVESQGIVNLAGGDPMTPVPITPMQMLATAVQGGRDLATIEKLMDLEQRWKDTTAREAFYKALAAFKSEPIHVSKDKKNLQYNSMYTTLGNLVGTVNAAMAPHGLNTRWTLDQKDGISVTCILSHTLGHSESVTMSGPIDESGKKNPLQQIKSTITYLESATFQAVTGVVSQDANADDDANAVVETVSEKEMADLESLITEVAADRKQFLKYLKIESLDELPKRSFGRAVTALEAKR